MKFLALFKKELKEMLSAQTIIIMVFTVMVLSMAGTALSSQIEEESEKSMDVTICDLDKTYLTDALLTAMEANLSEGGGKVKKVELESEDYAKELKDKKLKSIVIIPKGFTENVENNEQAKIKFVQKLSSLASFSNISTGSDASMSCIEAALKNVFYSAKVSGGQLTDKEVAFINEPLAKEEVTVVNDTAENISSSIVLSLCSAQNMIVPILMFVLLVFSSQMILNAVSSEKIDKTLETLLTSPISRMSVITAKMLAAAVVAAMQAVVYMIGMHRMMSGIYENAGDTEAFTKALDNLGLNMGAAQYVMVGVQMFLSILIALSISLILGVLAKDTKSAQTLTMPIMMMTMIPYMLSLFLDIKTLSTVPRLLVYAIPFTHAFTASENAMFANTSNYIFGALYQLVFLAVCLTVALKIFMSDKIFTMSLGGGRKHKKAADDE